ncbi:expressed unknown protein [Seminavis robusta]|uniref:Copper transport protein n=1 Tax=Seminavis robusta TaxID=568900 RepID=A0A9N8H4H4_9STRA|nr:expressed unknown protein [Seminavis robusta]|eukprot:Sro63_g035790.1 n/a (278) ;mRNA; r:61563-62467
MALHRIRIWRQQVLFVFLLSVAVLFAISVESSIASQPQVSAATGMVAAESQVLQGDDNHHHHHDDSQNSTFCHGMYMTVFMDGFRWSLGMSSRGGSDHHGHDNSTKSLPPCLAYYVRSWQLNMPGKFRGACVYSFLLALLTEALSASRIALIDYLRHPGMLQQRKIILTLVYALQSWMGTLIMLVAMMYSIELFFSVVAGLVVGNYMFVREQGRRPPAMDQTRTVSASAERYSDTGSPAGTAAVAEQQFNCCASNQDANSQGMGSLGGLQMQTRKEE